MVLRSGVASLAFAAAALNAPAPVHAATVALAGDGRWLSFAVDSLLAPPQARLGWIDDAGAPLTFAFAIGAGSTGALTVVDAAFAGDTFSVTNFGAVFGTTSPVPRGTVEMPIDVGLDFDAALRNPSFSRAVFNLAPGSYLIGGGLVQSVTSGGVPIEATAGAIRLSVAAVPEPSSLAMLLGGIGAIGVFVRRRRGLHA